MKRTKMENKKQNGTEKMMKRLIYSIVLLFIATGTISCMACKKEQNDDGTPRGGTFYCKIDGKEYKPKHVSGFKEGISSTIVVTGSSGNGEETVQFQCRDNISPGTYSQLNDMTASSYIGAFYSPPHSNEATDDGPAETGQVVITEHDTAKKRIKGTFRFKTKASINAGTVWDITDGAFDVTY
jgi:hypothetical protein